MAEKIFYAKTLDNYINCPCGHRVKRISYIYHKTDKTISRIGTSCLKKNNIKSHVKNGILLQVLTSLPLETGEWRDNILQSTDLDMRLYDRIQKEYDVFRERLGCQKELDYYDVVAPFRRLLNDVCDLVSDYGFNFILLLKNIETDVESMNQMQHIVVESDSVCDSISEVSAGEPMYAVEISNEHYDYAVPYEADPMPSPMPSPTLDSFIEDTFSISSIDDTFMTTEEIITEILDDVINNIIFNSFVRPGKEIPTPLQSKVPEEPPVNPPLRETTSEDPPATNTFMTKPNPICNTVECHKNIHCYCELKYRIRKLQENMAECRKSVQMIIEDTEKFGNKTETFYRRVFE